MDFQEIVRQAEEMVAAGHRADTEAVQRLARSLNIPPEPAEYLPAGARGQDREARRHLGPRRGGRDAEAYRVPLNRCR